MNVQFSRRGVLGVVAAAMLVVGAGRAAGQFTENFDGVAPPTLPVGWSSLVQGPGAQWTTVTDFFNSGPNAVFTNNANAHSDQQLTLPPIVSSGLVTIDFRRRFSIPNPVDGFIVEFSVDAGPFVNVNDAAWSLNGYNTTLSSNPGFSVIRGQRGFSGTATTWTRSTAQVPVPAGQTVTFKIRMVSGGTPGGPGVWIDDLSVSTTAGDYGSCCNAQAYSCTILAASNCPAPLVYASQQTCDAAPCPPPLNDDCSGAININVAGGGVWPYDSGPINVTAATHDQRDAECDTQGTAVLGGGLWWTYTTGASAQRVTLTETGTQAVIFSVWTGDCTSYAPVMCSDGVSDSFTVNLAANTTYQICVSKFTGNYLAGSTVQLTIPTAPVNLTAPANDVCTGAVDYDALGLPQGTTSPMAAVDYASATADVGNGTCDSNMGLQQGVWYRHTSGPVAEVISVGETSTEDCRFTLLNGPCGSPTVVSCGDGGTGATELVSFALAPSTTYFVVVSKGGSSTQPTGSTTVPTMITPTIRVDAAPPPPANDDCAGAIPIPSFPYTAPMVVSAGATDDFSANPACDNAGNVNGANRGVWYTFATGASAVTLAVSETSSQDSCVSFWTGTCGSLTAIDCNGAAVDTSSYIVQFPPSSTCYIVVSREPADVPTATEGYTLSVTAINPPANDLCSGAVNIPVPGTSPFTNTSLDGRGATPDANVSCNTAGAAELRGGVWYRFAPPAGGDDYNLTIAENSTADAVVAVYRGTSCAGLTQVFCSANDTGNSFVALAGNTYYINYGLQSAATTQPQVVYSISVAFAASTSACCNGATCTSVTRTVCGAIGGATYRGLPTTTCSAAVCGAPPVNDACAGAIALTTFPTAVTVPNAIAARDDVDVSCNGATPSDAAPVTRFGVWYSYTTGADAMIFGVGQLSSNNSVLGMFTGTCGNLTPVACSDPEGLSYTVPANTTAYVLIGMTNAVATPSAAGYSLVFDAVPVTGACCDGGSCTAGMTASACSGGNKLWLGASSTCVATPTFVSFPSAPIFIPYCCLSGVSDILLVSGYPGTISNVRVTVTLQGSRAGNLLLKLKGPNNVTLDLVSRAGATTNCNPLVQAVDGATTTLTGTYVFDDGAVQTLGAAAVVNAVTPSGAYRPSTCGAVPTSLAGAFAGIDPNGQWTLTAIDASGQIAAATLVSWGMTFNGSPSPCDNVGACCVGTACSQSISTMCAGTSTAAALCSANPCGATGVCCRGATCNAAVDAVSCTANAPVGASYASTSGVCNGGGSATFPCCYADFNKNGTLQVQDIFDFLNSWFAGSPFAKVGGDGSGGVLAVQDIFDFLNAWFAGC